MNKNKIFGIFILIALLITCVGVSFASNDFDNSHLDVSDDVGDDSIVDSDISYEDYDDDSDSDNEDWEDYDDEDDSDEEDLDDDSDSDDEDWEDYDDEDDSDEEDFDDDSDSDEEDWEDYDDEDDSDEEDFDDEDDSDDRDWDDLDDDFLDDEDYDDLIMDDEDWGDFLDDENWGNYSSKIYNNSLIKKWNHTYYQKNVACYDGAHVNANSVAKECPVKYDKCPDIADNNENSNNITLIPDSALNSVENQVKECILETNSSDVNKTSTKSIVKNNQIAIKAINLGDIKDELAPNDRNNTNVSIIVTMNSPVVVLEENNFNIFTLFAVLLVCLLIML